MPSHTTHFDDCGCLTARYEARIATLEAELAASRTDATLAWAEAKLIGEDEDAANLNAANWQAHANALRDALVWMRSHHSTTGTVLRRIEDALLATPAASLAALKAEVRKEALAGLLARIKGTVEWRDEFTNYGKAVRYVTQHVESALAAQEVKP